MKHFVKDEFGHLYYLSCVEQKMYDVYVQHPFIEGTVGAIEAGLKRLDKKLEAQPEEPDVEMDVPKVRVVRRRKPREPVAPSPSAKKLYGDRRYWLT